MIFLTKNEKNNIFYLFYIKIEKKCLKIQIKMRTKIKYKIQN